VGRRCQSVLCFRSGRRVSHRGPRPTGADRGVFTAAAGSIFIPDVSVNELNDPSKPLTGGGHNWVFDQGSTLCKETDVGGPDAVAPYSTTSATRIGIGGLLAPPPLPHHRAYGSVPRRR
jgi:hypothetical protein